MDVNVHPAKLEVRFVNERPIFDAVYHGVKSALHAGDKPKVMELKRPPVNPYAPVLEKKEQLRLEPQPPAQRPVQRSAPVPAPQKNQPLPERGVFLRDSGGQPERTPAFSGFLEQVLDREPRPVPPPARKPLWRRGLPWARRKRLPQRHPQRTFPFPQRNPPRGKFQLPLVREFHSRIIGEAFGTYLIVEYSKEELMFIDKHAAHERLLYERLKRENAGERPKPCWSLSLSPWTRRSTRRF